MRGGGKDLDSIGPKVGRALLRDVKPDSLPGQRMPDHNRAAVRRVRNADAAVPDRPDVDDHRCGGTADSTSTARRTSPAADVARSTTRPDDASW